MKKSEIQVGKTYTNGKGTTRRVVDEGEHLSWDGCMDRDFVQFEVVDKFRGPQLVGSVHRCTRASFASWAKSEVK